MQSAAQTVVVKGNYRIRKRMKNGTNGNKVNEGQMRKLSKLVEYLDSIKDQEMTGYIKINFNQGNICKIERYEEILKKD